MLRKKKAFWHLIKCLLKCFKTYPSELIEARWWMFTTGNGVIIGSGNGLRTEVLLEPTVIDRHQNHSPEGNNTGIDQDKDREIVLENCKFKNTPRLPRTSELTHWGRMTHTVKPLWKGQECLTKVAKLGPSPCTILYISCLFYPSWQATSFERPPSQVTFIEGFHCICVTKLGHHCFR